MKNWLQRSAVVLASGAALATGITTTAVAAEPVHSSDTITVSGSFLHPCPDGTVITYTAVVERQFTTWYDGGVAVREYRHVTFQGTLYTDYASVPYTGAYNREADFVTGDLQITGDSWRTDLPGGPTIVGAGFRDLSSPAGAGFNGSGERYLDALCTWFQEQR